MELRLPLMAINAWHFDKRCIKSHFCHINTEFIHKSVCTPSRFMRFAENKYDSSSHQFNVKRHSWIYCDKKTKDNKYFLSASHFCRIQITLLTAVLASQMKKNRWHTQKKRKISNTLRLSKAVTLKLFASTVSKPFRFGAEKKMQF